MSYTGIFDTHAHYCDPAFDPDRDELLAGLPAAGVTQVMLAGCSVADSRDCIALAERYPHVLTSVGIHPENLSSLEEGWYEQLRTLAAHERVRAIGEIGLDYHYEGYDKALQEAVLRRQLALAQELGLPVILHIREAMGDALRILHEVKPRGVVHCFSGSAEVARELVQMGLYIGIGGVLTFPNARKAVQAVQAIPPERIVFETDCPYLAPVPCRGQRCDSRMIGYTAERAAELLGMDAQELIDLAAGNGKKLFGLER